MQDLGTGVTFTPALTAAHASGAPVIGPGTGITISAPLSAAQAAGATVRGTPGTLTGDANGFNGVGVAASRAENWTFSAPGHARQRRQRDPGRRALPVDHADHAGHASS